MKVRLRDSIPVRLGFGVLIVTLAAFALMLLIAAKQEENQYTKRHLSEARNIALVTAAELGDLMMAGGGTAAWNTVSTKAVQRGQLVGALRILVLNKDGLVKAGSESASIGTRIDTTNDAECPACDSAQAGDFPTSAILPTPDGSRSLRVVSPIPADQACKACHAQDEEIRGYITIDFDLSSLENSAQERRRSILMLGLISGIVMLALIALLFKRLVMRPVNALIGSVQRLASGNLGERTEVLGRNELGLLACDFNRMAERIEEQVTKIEAANTESALLYTLVTEASKNLETTEFAMSLSHVIFEKLHPAHTAFFLETADSSWICAAAAKQHEEIMARGEGTLEVALVSNTAQVQQLLGGVPPGLVSDALRTKELQFKRQREELTLALPVVAEARLVGLLVCVGVTAGIRVGEEMLNNLGAHLMLATVNSRNYTGAITDGLTQLKNKRYGLARLNEAVFAAGRYKSALALAMCDIDNFKRINDIYGHPAGDAVLREVSRRIADCVRRPDIAVRYGGEEFMLILVESDIDSLAMIGERIRQAVAMKPIDLGAAGGALEVTVSVGITDFRDDTDNYELLINRADRMLYRAKQSGRNRVEVDLCNRS